MTLQALICWQKRGNCMTAPCKGCQLREPGCHGKCEAVLECYWPDGTSETRRVKVTDGFMKALRYWTELEEEENK